MTVSGAGGVLGMLVTVTVRGEGLAGPAASRPRGRPFAAYVVSCVGMMTLPAGRRTDASRCDSIDRPDLNDDQVFNALSTKILTLPSRVERAHPTRLRGCRHHDCCRRRTRSSRASQPPPRRHYPLPLRSGTTRKPLVTRAQRTRFTFRCTDAHRGRPRGRDGAAPQVPFPAYGSSSATSPDARSPSGGRTRWRATSMRPTESEGVAEGEDEDEAGEVRSERSGPQSRAPAIGSARPRGDLRSRPTKQKTSQKQPFKPSAAAPQSTA